MGETIGSRWATQGSEATLRELRSFLGCVPGGELAAVREMASLVVKATRERNAAQSEVQTLRAQAVAE